MKTLALLSMLSTLAVQGGQVSSTSSIPAMTLLVTRERILDPDKYLLKPVSPIAIESRQEVVKAAIKGELVVKDGDVTAIYSPSVLSRFPRFELLLAAKAYLSGQNKYTGRTDQDEWARLAAIELVSGIVSKEASITVQKLYANGFAEHPGEVVLEPAYCFEVEIGGKKVLLICSRSIPDDSYSRSLGEGFAWSSVSQMISQEEHLYSTFDVESAKSFRKRFDDKLTEIFKSDEALLACARAIKEKLEIPYGSPMNLSSLPSELYRALLLALPTYMTVAKLDPDKFTENDIKSVKLVGVGLSTNMVMSINGRRSYSSKVRRLPNP